MNKINWTKQMDDRLRALYPKVFTRELVESMGISQRTIIRRARVLGLEKEPGFLYNKREEIKQLARINHPGNRMKGVKGWSVPNSEKTRFQRGERNGAAADANLLKKAWETRRLRKAEEPKKSEIELIPEYFVRIF